MNIRDLANLITRLAGLYLILQGLIIGGMPFFNALGIFIGQDPSVAISAFGIGVSMALATVIVGILIVKLSNRISTWLVKTCDFKEKPVIEGKEISIESVTVLAYSIVGLILLVQTLPSAISSISSWIQIQFWSEIALQRIGQEEPRSLAETLPNLVYHLVAVGMSFWIFMKGKSIYLFFETFRRTNNKAQPVAGGDRPR